MKGRARLLGVPVHQMLVVFPLGLLATSFFFDLGWVLFRRAELARVAWWLILAGVIGGAAASLFGIIDWVALARQSRARRTGAWHGVGNAGVAILFAVSWMLRRDDPGHPEALAILLSALGVLLMILTGWLGWELAERMEDEGSELPSPRQP